MSRAIGTVSRAEMERRWALVRTHLRDREIDALVAISSDANFDGGYVRWLTHEPFAYRRALIFHVDDLMSSFEHGADGAVRTTDGTDESHRGVGAIHSFAMFPAVGHSNHGLFDMVATMLAERGYRRIGLLGPDAMPYGLISAIQTRLGTAADITDESESVDRMIACKSPEEQQLIRATVDMQSAIFEKLLTAVRPGMRDLDVTQMVRRDSYTAGGTGGIALAGSAARGAPALLQLENRQGRVIGDGDTLTLLIETTGPGGYFAELGRTLVFGRASAELEDAFALALEAQTVSRSATRPGSLPADIFRTYNDFLAARGQMPEMRVHSHGQGYDIVARPLIKPDESMLVVPGMFLSVHPGIVVKGNFAFLCDNFFVEETAAGAPLHTVPQKLFELA